MNSFLIAFDLYLGNILSDVINVKMIMAMCPEYSYISMKTVTHSTMVNSKAFIRIEINSSESKFT